MNNLLESPQQTQNKTKKIYNYDESLQASVAYFNGDELAAKVFVDKYALKDKDGNILEKTPEDMHRRLAKEFARIEKNKFQNPLTENEIFYLLDRFRYIIPQGSPMFGIGNKYQYVSLSNCYLLDIPVDSYGSILQVDEQLVQISKRRGGVGVDLSNLRPAGTPTKNAAKSSTGIIPFMERYSNSIREVGQCIAKGQKVLTKRGLTNIEDVIIGDLTWTKNGWVSVKKVFYNGVKPIFKLKCKAGFEIKTSKDHLFQTFNNLGELTETRLENLKISDRIVLCLGPGDNQNQYQSLLEGNYKNTNNKPPGCSLPKTFDEQLAYIIGYTKGDAVVLHTEHGELGLELACADNHPQIKEKLKNYIFNKFEYTPNVRKGDGKLEKICIDNKTIIQFLKLNNLLKEKTEYITVPNIILKSPSSVQLAFLCGYFDADGYASGAKKGYCFASVNPTFIKSCQTLLMSLGIVSKIHKEDRTKLGWQDLYSLVVVGKTSQETFVNKMLESVKVQNLLFVSKRDNWLTPFRAKSFGVSHNKFAFCPDNTQYLSLNIIKKLKKSGINVINNLIQDEITNIEYVGEQETYDLCLDSEHLFWCEGYYVHNSNRRGALMITLSVHHPEVLEFTRVKNDRTKVTGANISLRLSKEFLDAVENNSEYEVRFPIDYKSKGIKPIISKRLNARDVWKEIIKNARDHAEPGLLMWDNITQFTPADCYEEYASKGVNPCSEINLSPLDSCRLLCLNLFSYVRNPFTKDAFFDYDLFSEHAKIAQRLMDDLVDLESEMIDRIINKIKCDPEPEEVKSHELNLWIKIKKFNDEGRRTGTGITALADALAAIGIKYGSERSIAETEKIYRTLKLSCYWSSVDMAEELGAFKVWDAEKEKLHPFLLRIKNEDPVLYNKMQQYGRRNISLTTTAPTGTVSILCQTSSGIEPVFKLSYTRRRKINPNDKNNKVDFIDQNGDKWEEFKVYHPTVYLWSKITGETDETKSPWHNCCAEEIDWINRVKLQAAAQLHVCHAISATINLPEDVSEEMVAKIYETAFKSGLKGITIYRKNCRSGVLIDSSESSSSRVVKTRAPKRPQSLPGVMHHFILNKQRYYVVVGLLNGDPYEIFTGLNHDDSGEIIIPKTIHSGFVVKEGRGKYVFQVDNSAFPLTNGHNDDTADALTRVLSCGLRHGTCVSFLVHQLEKTKGPMTSFSKILARTLKKYIKDGTVVTGESCPQCQSNNLVRSDGCVTCKQCGFSKC